MKARKKPIKGKYNALIRRPVRKPGIKNPIATKKPGNVLLDRMQRIAPRVRALDLIHNFKFGSTRRLSKRRDSQRMLIPRYLYKYLLALRNLKCQNN